MTFRADNNKLVDNNKYFDTAMLLWGLGLISRKIKCPSRFLWPKEMEKVIFSRKK